MKYITFLFAVLFLSVMVSGCTKAVSVDCVTKMKDVQVEKKALGDTFNVKCPAGCSTSTAWGTDIYTTDSSVCKAAVHAGIIAADKGGTVKVSIVKGLDKYSGSEKNGVSTSDWNTSWGNTAFAVSK